MVQTTLCTVLVLLKGRVQPAHVKPPLLILEIEIEIDRDTWIVEGSCECPTA